MATLYSLRTGNFATTASATKSAWLLNPATDGLLPVAVSFSFAASVSSATIGVELYRTTTLGSPAGTTGTIVKYNNVNAASSTAAALTALTTEPTAVEVLEEYEVQPFGGLVVVQYPLGREPGVVAAGARLGLRYVTPASVNPNMRSFVVFEEQ